MTYRILNILFVITLVIFLYLYLEDLWSFWPVVLLVLGYILFLLVVSTNVGFNFFVKAYNRNPDFEGNSVALSFDDGPNQNTLKILDILDRHEVKATFFCIGQQVEAHPEVFREILKRGHLVGNHTYSHTRKIGFLKSSRIIEEIEACDKVVKDRSGLEMRLFRPPFGIINPKVKRALAKTGHQVIGWNNRPYDAITSSPERILKRILKNLDKGDLILLHDNIEKTSVVLEQLLVKLKQRNLGVVRLDKLFDIDAYTN
ncbi:polysaccharide deacetylase family protein [Gramella sp. GC03-9]|uniref:Polysaccharide deacetylase family protein n=1 Tax=Christiangramia oceanisediminis TaxID=2920386 RepID=A0A9X2KYB4_9FLAO|nr:polysaccharide deacetylase family protein [Gramella oceanisediminis]MCP9200466.1 polysaccharide deacetylase family protein [Gramella oceanisediminis]